MHVKPRRNKFAEEIEIQTLVSTFKFPDLFTKESLELKKAIVNCTLKDVFRTELIQSYIDADWQNFAWKYAYTEFGFYLIFVATTMN